MAADTESACHEGGADLLVPPIDDGFNTVNFLLTIIQGSSSLDIGLSGRSLSQITVTIHHRFPSQNSSMLFTPRSITGPCSEYLLSYVLRTLAMLPNFSVLRCI